MIDYRSLIAGSALATKDHDSVAHRQACSALDSDAVLIHVVVEDDRAKYLALPGRAAANTDVLTPLAAVFRSHPNHRGDGIYLHPVPGGMAAVVRSGTRFEALYNSVAAVRTWLGEPDQRDLPQHDVSSGMAWPLRPMRLSRLWDGRSLMAKVAILNFWGAVAMVSLSVIVGIAATVGHALKPAPNASRAVQISQIASSDLARYNSTLHDFSLLAALMVRAGGWIEKYSFKEGKVSFEAYAPGWVTAESIKELGAVETEKDFARNLVIVRRSAKP